MKKWSFTLLLVLAILVTACVQGTPIAPVETQAPVETEPPVVSEPPEATQPPVEEPTATTAPPAEKKVATFIFTQEFDTLNPYMTNMWFSEITHELWSCWAWSFDDKNAPIPRLVTEMPSVDNGGISPDGTVLTMKLRDDIVWSDGTPITANDFVFTYQMIVDPANTVATTHPYAPETMVSVEAPDERTVVITFVEPFAPWIGTMWQGLLPAHILQPVYDAEGTINEAEWNMAPVVGCGPFVFEEWESGSYARFVKNENYWAGQPLLDEIFIRFVPDDAAQIAAITAGEGDLGTFFAYPDVPTLEAADITVYKVMSGYNEGIYFYLGEQGHPAIKDVKVRQAIALATDRFSLSEDLLLGLTVPASTDWDNTPYNDPTLEPWPYDPDQARTLLDEAGWVDSNGDGTRDKDGTELVLSYGTTTRDIRRDTQAVLQQQLAEVGIKVELQNYDSDLFFSGYEEDGPAATGQLDMFQYSSVANFPDPDIGEWLCDQIPTDEEPSGTNWQAVCDEELDALFREQAKQVDFAERQATFQKITRHIFENVYFLALWQDPDLWGVNERLLNVKISGATPFFNIIEWDLTQ